MAKKTRRTEDEIKRQVEGIKKMRVKLPQFSAFGDPNWKALDAQIFIITGQTTYESYSNAENYVESEAYRAKEWMDGDTDEDLFDE